MLKLIARIALFLMLIVGVTLNASDEALNIESVYPSGDNLDNPRQIIVKFNKNIANFPYPSDKIKSLPSQINISPDIKCDWKFIEGDTIACNILGDLAQATTYSIVVYPSFTSYEGKSLSRPYRHSFTTTRPKATFTSMKKWLSPGKPMFRVIFNQKISEIAVEHSLYIADNNGNRYAVLAQPSEPGIPALLKKTQPKSKADQGPIASENRTEWLVYPKKELPHETHIKLISAAGLESTAGPQVSTDDQELFSIKTFGSPKIIDAKCINGDNSAESLLTANTKVKCNPKMPIMLVFNNPITAKTLQSTIAFRPTPAEKLSINVHQVRDNEGISTYEATIYSKWIPAKEHVVIINNDNRFFLIRWVSSFIRLFNKKYDLEHTLHDEFGQVISKKIKLAFRTGNLNPEISNADKKIIDSNEDDDKIDIKTVNIKTINYDYKLISAQSLGLPEYRTISQKTTETAMNMPAITMLDNNELFGAYSGAAYGYISSFPKVSRSAYLNNIFIERTPFSLRATLVGNDISVILFNRKTAELIDDAQISLIRWEAAGPTNINKKDSWEVITKSKTSGGVGLLAPSPNMRKQPNIDTQYLILAQKDNDIALLPLNYGFTRKINTDGQAYHSDEMSNSGYGLTSWGITDKVIYAPGDIVNYKIYVRNKNLQTNDLYKSESYNLEVNNATKTVIHKRENIRLSEFGEFSGSFQVPPKTEYGRHSFNLMYKNGPKEVALLAPINILVDNFQATYASSKTALGSNKVTSEDGLIINIDAHLLHNGEPLKDTQISTQIILQTKPYRAMLPALKDLYFSSADADSAQQTYLGHMNGTLDSNGHAQFLQPLSVTKGQGINYGVIRAETITKDLSGRYIFSSAASEFFKAGQLVGIKSDSTTYGPKSQVQISAAIIDASGNMPSGIPIKITIERNADDNTKTWKKHASTKIYSSDHEVSRAAFKITKPGTYRAIAEVKNANNEAHKSIVYFYVIEGCEKNVETLATDNTTIKQDKEIYNVGDTAHYIINNPYKNSNAIITLARDGIIESFAKQLPPGPSIIDIEIKEEYAPGFYMYIDFVSKDADSNIPMIKTLVRNPANELDLALSSNRDTYKPGEKVTINIQTRSQRAMNVALIVVDEAVLNTAPESYIDYDIAKFFNKFNNSSTTSYSLFSAANNVMATKALKAQPGMTGNIISGTHAMRMFHMEDVAYWDPNINLGPEESIEITFANPNKATKWIVFAIAADKDKSFAYRTAQYTSSSDMSIYATLPSKIVGGDNFIIKFIVSNRKEEAQNIALDIDIEGATILGDRAAKTTINLAPKEERVIKQHIATTATSLDSIHINALLSNDHEQYGTSYTIAVQSALQNYISSSYRVIEHSDRGLIPRGSQNDSVIMRLFQPIRLAAADLLKDFVGQNIHSHDISKISWREQLVEAASTAVGRPRRTILTMQTPVNSPRVQNIIFSATEYQNPSGSMLMYKKDSEYSRYNQFIDVNLTIDTAIIFQKLKQMGYIIPVDVEDKIVHNLKEYFDNNKAQKSKIKPLTRLARALAIYGNNGARIDHLYKLTNNMDIESLSDYLIALHSNSDDVYRDKIDYVIKKITNSPFRTSGSLVFANGEGNVYNMLLYNCGAMEALSDIMGAKDLAKTAHYIVNSMPKIMGPQYLKCFEALYKYSNIHELGNDNIVKVAIDNREVINQKLSKNISMISLNGLKKRPTEYQLETNGNGSVLYSIMLSEKLSSVEAHNNGIQVKKKFSKIIDGKLSEIKGPLQVNVGDIICTEILITSSVPLTSIKINEHPPGGLEMLSPSFTTSAYTPGNSQSNLLSIPHVIDGKGSIKIQKYDIESSKLYNLYYFSYAKTPGKFKVLATTIYADKLEDISGSDSTGELNIYDLA